MTRTDLHRPSTFIPADYRFITVIDLSPTSGLQPRDFADAGVRAYLALHRGLADRYRDRLAGDNRSLAQCSVCGNHFRWAVIWEHLPTGSCISTGEDCAGTFSAHQANQIRREIAGLAKAASDFGKLARTRSAWLAEGERRAEAIDFINETVEHEDAGAETYAGHQSNFIWILQSAWKRYGNLTDKQLAAVLAYKDNALGRGLADAARAAIAQEREAQRTGSQFVGKPGERREFTARIAFVKTIEGGQWGDSTLYGLVDSDGNALRWFASRRLDAGRGDTVRLRGTVKKHEAYQGEKQTVLTRCTLLEDKLI